MKWSINKYPITFGVLAAFLSVISWFFMNDSSWKHFEHIWLLLLTILLIVSIAIIFFYKGSKEGISIKKFILSGLAYSIMFFFMFSSIMIYIAWGKTGKVNAAEILADAVKLVRETHVLKANPEIFVNSNKDTFYIFDNMVIGNDLNSEVTVIVLKNIDGSQGMGKCFIFPKRHALSVCNKLE